MERFNVIIIGGGISGLVAGIEIRRQTRKSVLILEKGDSYEARIASGSPDLIVGLGGAGTVCGGKLCYPPASGTIWEKTREEFKKNYAAAFAMYGAGKDLPRHKLIVDRVHSGAYYEKGYESELISQQEMHAYIRDLISQADECGVEIRVKSEMVEYKQESAGKVIHYLDESRKDRTVCADFLIFAGGRASSPEIDRLLKQVGVKEQMPDLGIRLQMPRSSAGLFQAVGRDVKLKMKYEDILVRTFCVCSGGHLAQVRMGNNLYFDGHFDQGISDSVNFGVLARSPELVGTKAALDYIEDYQNMVDQPISCKWFMENFSQLAKSDAHRRVFNAIVVFLDKLLETRAFGQDADAINVYLPSVDRLNPHVITDSSFRTRDPFLYVIGDAAGISRGFVQAQWSGFCAARGVITSLKEEEDSVILCR